MKRKKVYSKQQQNEAIARLFGCIKRKPGDKSFDEERADHKREERELEESKYARCFGTSSKRF